jgi:uncharacterized protein (TIGR03118 family)
MPFVRTFARKTVVLLLGLCWLVSGFATSSRADSVTVTNLITDDQSVNQAQITDQFLKNPWGVSYAPGGPFWVSDNATGVTTLYRVNPTTNVTNKVILGMPPDPSGGVVIPPFGSATPTGQVFNAGGSSAFNGDAFLFVSEDGTIAGWRGALGTKAEVLQTADTANVYKGVTQVNMGGHSYLLSANFRAGSIDVMKGDALAPNLTGNFNDPNLPSGYAPFNIKQIGSKVYVTYALQDSAKHDDSPGAGHGFVSAFDLQGNFLGRIGTMGTLNSPWGLALAPSSFGKFAGDLLVGNFGDGTINVFSADPSSPGFLGQLMGSDGKAISIDGLWSLTAGNDGNAGSSQNIFFAAGPNGEVNGLFGVLQAVVPEPTSMVLALTAIGFVTGRRAMRRRPSSVSEE